MIVYYCTSLIRDGETVIKVPVYAAERRCPPHYSGKLTPFNKIFVTESRSENELPDWEFLSFLESSIR